jgi:hypothetical protein
LEHGEAEVMGCAPPQTDVAVAMRDRSGNLRGSGTTTTEAAGGYHLRLTDPSGAPITVATGDVAELTATGDQPVVRAEPLWLRREPDGTLTGGGAPDREIVLVFEFAGGRRASHSLRSGPEGEFRFTRADLPVEADWSPMLAERVRAFMATDNDHFIGVAGVAAPRVLFLPLCQTRRQVASIEGLLNRLGTRGNSYGVPR